MTQTVTWGNPATQWGSSTGGVWTTLPFNDLGNFATVAQPTLVGFIFTPAGLRFSGGVVVDAPVVSGITLNFPCLQRDLLSVPEEGIELFFVPEEDVADFSNTALPLTRGEISLGTYELFVDNFATPTYSSATIPASALVDVRAFVTSRARWTGRIAFVMQHTDVVDLGFFLGNSPTTPLTATVTQELFFAGLVGGPSGKARAVRDGRFAMPAFNHELVRDGDNPGLWVRSFDADPDDPETKYRPRPGEGSVDDEIPDLG
jgi:hypothetical protein